MKPRGIVLHTVGVRGDTTVAAIRKYHTTPVAQGGRGWADIGYHFVVRKDGTIETGRSLTRAGAHTQGANDTIGICVTGDGDREPWTVAQLASVAALCARQCKLHGWGTHQVCGHREAPARLGAAPTSKTCPGKLVDLDEVRKAVRNALAALAVGATP